MRLLLPILVTGALGLAAPAGAAVTEHTVRVGPIKVSGYAVKQWFELAPHPQIDGHITRMSVDLVDADGTPIPISRLMLHHIVFINASKFDSTCPSFTNWDSQSVLPGRQRFMAAGEERARMVLPDGYGYEMNALDQWGVLYMMMNHKPTLDEAYIEYKLTVDTDPSIKDVKPYWLDVANCQADPIYNVPGSGEPGSTHVRSADFTFPESGRIVAGGGHVHGGARLLRVTEPNCDNREIARSEPTWGLTDHPFYNVKPVLHEPGPISMSAFTTPTGIPVNAGETVRLESHYDNSRPHTRVMGIEILYLDPDSSVNQNCGALPGDIETITTDQPGRDGPIPYRIPLTGLDDEGNAITIKRPPGRTIDLGNNETVEVRDTVFTKKNVHLDRGSTLNWLFDSSQLHNVTLANGPRAIGSPNLNGDRVFSHTFRRRGTYRLFCALHPVAMSERVVVGKRTRTR
jgi:plastocyanin